MSNTIQEISSPTHSIRMSHDKEDGLVELQDATMDQVFVLIISTADSKEPRVWIEVPEEKDDQYAGMLVLQSLPGYSNYTKAQEREIVFLIDNSGIFR